MAARKAIIESPTWRPRSRFTSEVQLHLCGSHFTLDKELLASKSAKVSNLLERNPYEDLSAALRDIPADQESMELVGRFCHGFEINLSTENIVRIACVAHYLEMTDSHCRDNLLSTALMFFERCIVTSWNNCIKALKSAENVLQHAVKLGLVSYCVESIILMVLEDPHLLGEPLADPNSDDEDDDESDDENENTHQTHQPIDREKLFGVEWKSEDLTTLSLRLYMPIIRAMAQRHAPEEYVAANLCQYTQKWVFSNVKTGENLPIYKKTSYKETVEAVVSLLPQQRDVVPCSFLFELLRYSVALDVTADCKNELEIRIGKQLDQATVNDLLIPSQGYAKDEQYDTELVRRILKHFYCNYVGPHACGLNTVADLIDDFLAEISADIDLKVSTFLEFADISVAASTGTPRTSDGIYRAIDIYLDKHRYLTESEKEELCKVLDCNKLSIEACEHAAQNERLPVRIIVQALFAAQLKLREVIPKEMQSNGETTAAAATREEIEKMGSKVMELERECNAMKREMQIEKKKSGGRVRKKKKRVNIWKEMKKKMGCKSKTTNVEDCNCHVKKKVHPS
ncbi:BTB/POZ domain-containing protein At5g17580-like [Andrographis paniculata]|uniref:BTB/POZ domain-containing protein At5g17580-like n=1 Tax=Andrographis paniculata TaxID=175694 RepID=UPI0021E901C8|nr:BTB/POZ domain-containing protein At5g17580-like [Andrographis paniculata]XP_051123908.1 BTB/POZ domain-containing protein At5g17580-like [Andrographis paniculata]